MYIYRFECRLSYPFVSVWCLYTPSILLTDKSNKENKFKDNMIPIWIIKPIDDDEILTM